MSRVSYVADSFSDLLDFLLIAQIVAERETMLTEHSLSPFSIGHTTSRDQSPHGVRALDDLEFKIHKVKIGSIHP
jgi:hypothetical protein